MLTNQFAPKRIVRFSKHYWPCQITDVNSRNDVGPVSEDRHFPFLSQPRCLQEGSVTNARLHIDGRWLIVNQWVKKDTWSNSYLNLKRPITAATRVRRERMTCERWNRLDLPWKRNGRLARPFRTAVQMQPRKSRTATGSEVYDTIL